MKIFEIILHELRLGKGAREYAEAMIMYLRTEGVTDYRIEFGGKHPRLVFSYLGRPLYYSFPNSPSDSRRGARNAVSDLRRMLSQIASQPAIALPLQRR